MTPRSVFYPLYKQRVQFFHHFLSCFHTPLPGILLQSVRVVSFRKVSNNPTLTHHISSFSLDTTLLYFLDGFGLYGQIHTCNFFLDARYFHLLSTLPGDHLPIQRCMFDFNELQRGVASHSLRIWYCSLSKNDSSH